MTKQNHLMRAVTVAGLFLCALAAHAVPITNTYHVQLFDTSNPQMQLGQGSFTATVESSVAEDLCNSANCTVSAFSFDVLGETFGLADLLLFGYKQNFGVITDYLFIAGSGSAVSIGVADLPSEGTNFWQLKDLVSGEVQTFEPNTVRTTVPEPATLSLLGLSLLGMRTLRRKQSVNA
jgi:PEP-CTERM motif